VPVLDDLISELSTENLPKMFCVKKGGRREGLRGAEICCMHKGFAAERSHLYGDESHAFVPTADHWLGKAGKDYLSWLMFEMKMAMIFRFEINFWYDLRSPHLKVTDTGQGSFMIPMPQCLYTIRRLGRAHCSSMTKEK
jgi:hypothetical protein